MPISSGSGPGYGAVSAAQYFGLPDGSRIDASTMFAKVKMKIIVQAKFFMISPMCVQPVRYPRMSNIAG
jgi:hypothetical protein